MAVGRLGVLGYASSKTAGTTISINNTTGQSISTGVLIHICGTWDNIASVTAPTITYLGNGTGTANHATAIGSGVTTTAGSGVWHQCFRVLTSGSVGVGANIGQLTSNQSAVVRSAIAVGFDDCTTTLRGTVATGVSTTGSPSAASAGTALVLGDLVVGSCSYENSAMMTADADTTNGPWSPITGTFTTGSTANTNVGSVVQSKAVSATGVQTYNPTGGVADAVACVVSYVPLATSPESRYTVSADVVNVGDTVVYTDATLDPVTSWDWRFFGSNTQSASTKGPHSITFNAPGLWYATYTATNATGLGVQTSKPVLVRPLTATTLRKRGTSVVATTGTWASTANAIDGAPGTNQNTYATWTSATASEVATIQIGGFDFSSLPADYAYMYACVFVRHYESDDTLFSNVRAHMMDGTTSLFSLYPIGEYHTPTDGFLTEQSGAIPTRAVLTSPTFKVEISATKTTDPSSSVLNIDWVDVIIVYEPLPSQAANSLVEKFDTLDTTKWYPVRAYAGPSGTDTVAVTGGQLALTGAAITQSNVTYRSQKLYNLLNSSIIVEQITPATLNWAVYLSIWPARSLPPGASRIGFGTYSTQRVDVIGPAGTNPALPYDPVAHRWLKIEGTDASTITFYTSPDGTNWTLYMVGTTYAALITYGVRLDAVRIGLELDCTTTSTALTANWDNLNNPPAAKVETLTDTFDTGLDKATKWPATSASTVWDAGRARISIASNYWNLGTTAGYNLTGSSLFAKVTPTTGGTKETFMEVIQTGGTNNYKLSLFCSGTDIGARRTVNGTPTQATAIPYNATNHAWWRIRESAGTTYFEVSPDATTWTGLWSIANGMEVTNMWVNFSSGFWGGDATGTYTYIDNVNVLPGAVTAGRPKVNLGAGWVTKPAKVNLGAGWVEKPMKKWNGTAWVPIT